VLAFPQKWDEQKIKTDQHNEYVTLKVTQGGTAVVADYPFNWIEPPIPQNHFCLIAAASCEGYPNPVDSIKDVFSLGDFASWVTANKAIAWRNTQMSDPGDVVTFTSPLKPPSDWGGGFVQIQAVVTNMPIGVSVAFSTGVPNPPLNLNPTKTTQSNQSLGVPEVYLPAGYSSYLSYSLWRNGLQIPPEATLQLNFQAVTTAASPLWGFGVRRANGWEEVITLGSLQYRALQKV